MSTLTPDHWKAVSPYLDQALEMQAEEREAWLASLREQNPTLAADLRTLLDEHRALVQEQYMEEGPLPPGGEALAGKTIGAYTLRSPIGQGGMGTVWLAERSDGRFQRRVAVKFLKHRIRGGRGAIQTGGQHRWAAYPSSHRGTPRRGRLPSRATLSHPRTRRR